MQSPDTKERHPAEVKQTLHPKYVTSGAIQQKSITSTSQASDKPVQPTPVINGIPQVILGKDAPFLIKIQNNSHFYQEASFWFSLVALGVTLYNLFLAKRKDTVSRRQSINDEFWLRKVLFPTSIEPVLEFFSSTLNGLPADRFDTAADATVTEKFRQTTIDEYRALATKLITVGILNQDLYKALSNEFEKVEDLITDYCYANKDGFDLNAVGIDHLKATTEAQLSEHMLKMLKSIKQLQETMK